MNIEGRKSGVKDRRVAAGCLTFMHVPMTGELRDRTILTGMKSARR